MAPTVVVENRNEPHTSQEFVSARQIAEVLGIHKRTALRMCADGRLRSIRLGQTVRVPTSELVRLRREAGLAEATG